MDRSGSPPYPPYPPRQPRPNPLHEGLADVPSMHERLTAIEANTRDLNSSVLALQGDVKSGFVKVHEHIARTNSHVLSALSTLYDRVEKNFQDDAARDAAAKTLHANLEDAKEEAVALGAQAGLIAAEAAEARKVAHSVSNEIATVKKAVDAVEAADRGWLHTGRVVGKFVKANVITALVGAILGGLIKHFLLN